MRTTATMPDPRFYDLAPPMSLADLAALTGASVLAGEPGRMLRGPARIEEAGEADFAFCGDARMLPALRQTGAGAVFIKPDWAGDAPAGAAVLAHAAPQAAFSMAAAAMAEPKPLPLASDPAVHPSASLGEGVQLGLGAAIGPGAKIGPRTRIGPYAVIGPGVEIGEDGDIGAHAVIRCAVIGPAVRVLAGAVIGEAGFGVAAGPEGPIDQPQLGTVEIAREVSIGAMTAIDRGAFGATSIGPKTKIDNLCQIAHNCRIGTGVVMAARAGISGSCEIGDYVMMGGRVGVSDHVKVGRGARLAANAAVMSDVPPGAVWGGYPARNWDEYKRMLVASLRLVRNRSKDTAK